MEPLVSDIKLFDVAGAPLHSVPVNGGLYWPSIAQCCLLIDNRFCVENVAFPRTEEGLRECQQLLQAGHVL
jgi:hypothetical protein